MQTSLAFLPCRSSLVTVALCLCLTLSTALAGSRLPYIGSWSNGRGETLIVTADTIQFADDEPVEYKDVTRASDGNSFQLRITTRGHVNAFDGKFLGVECSRSRMTIKQYVSFEDCRNDENPGSEVRWDRDK